MVVFLFSLLLISLIILYPSNIRLMVMMVVDYFTVT